MAGCQPPSLEEMLWTIAAARLIFGPAMNIQAPPNLAPGISLSFPRAKSDVSNVLADLGMHHPPPLSPRLQAMTSHVASATLPVISQDKKGGDL